MSERTYFVEIDDRSWPIQIADGPDGLRVRVGDGAWQAADFILAEHPAVYSLLLDGRSYTLSAAVDTTEAGVWDIGLGHQQFRARVESERAHRLRRLEAQRPASSGEVPVKAPMPGLVRAVTVAPGDQVEKGQRLVILEAMKMENEIQAPRAGQVKAIQVKAGDTVENGRVLVVLA